MTNQQLWALLPERRRRKLLSKHRYIDVEYGLDWWDCIFEQFVEQCKEQGIEVDTNRRTSHTGRNYSEPDICFSGFWSQGDGACFGGSVVDWPVVLNALGESRLIEHALEAGWSFSSKTTHRNSMQFTDGLEIPENPFDEETQPLQFDAWGIGRPDRLDLEILSKALEEMFDDLASQLYRDLEEEYEYLTGDEYITEYILEHLTPEEILGDEVLEDLQNQPAEMQV